MESSIEQYYLLDMLDHPHTIVRIVIKRLRTNPLGLSRNPEWILRILWWQLL